MSFGIPLVSIILTTFNGARYIQQSIDSCLEQTYPNIELIIVDGGSEDGTLEIIAQIHDQRVTVIHQSNNIGKLPGALNLGLAKGKGEYLSWTQDDSFYLPNAIEIMMKTLEDNPVVDQVYANYFLVKEDGSEEIINVHNPDQLASAKSDYVGVCFLIRRKVREVIGEHSIEAYPSQDYDYRLRVAQKFSSIKINQPLYYYRYHANSLTGKLGWAFLARTDVNIRLRLGISDQRQAVLDLADIDIAEAFEKYRVGNYIAVIRLVANGISRKPVYLNNRGLWSIFLRSSIRVICQK